MEQKKYGNCPIESGTLLTFAMNCLREEGALDFPGTETCRALTEKIAGLLPDHYFPDVYFDIPLMNGAFGGMAVVLDCYDRCYLNAVSEGAFFRNLNIPDLTEPEERDTLSVLYFSGSGNGEGPEFFTVNKNAFSEIEEGLPGVSPFSAVTITTGPPNPRKRFPKRPFHDNLLKELSSAGCPDDALRLPDLAAFNCGVPYLDPKEGYQEWPVCMDAAAFRVTKEEGSISDAHAVIRISDRSVRYSRLAIKHTQAYQWHITDDCDQRCRHCYLFAEDAKLKCVSTPYEQLLHTLDEITLDAASRYGYPMPVISGGDPILHPDFWRFAEEIHRRGFRWSILGNPFHLNEEVCRKLYQLGCYKYQLSLDGLAAFHDHMRKPGSFQATLDAAKLLKEAGLQTQFMATVSRQNLDDVIACMDIAADVGVSDFTFARYCATSPEKAIESYPTPEEYRAFLLRYYNKKNDYERAGCKTRFKMKEHLFTLLRYELGDFVIPEYSKKHPQEVMDGCHLGIACSILSNGDLMACRRMESVIGNVNEKHIKDILTSDLCMRYADVRNIKKCKDCELLNWCRGCRAVGYNVTGDLQGEDPMCWKKD